MSLRYGQKPRPRVLIAADEPQLGEALAERLRLDLGLQTVGLIEDDTYFPEWDCVVSVSEDYYASAKHLRVISFGTKRFGPLGEGGFGLPYGSIHSGTRSDELEVPADLDQRIRRLVQSDLRPDLQGMELKPYLSPSDLIREPFLTAGVRNEFVLAGAFTPSSGGPDFWVLPPWANAVAWIRQALEIWSEQDPERFPPTPEWWRTPDWRTKTERDAEERLSEIRQQAETEYARLLSEVQAAEAEVLKAQERADSIERLLLRGQGDDLVAVVAETLEKLGFDVTNMDGVYPAGSLREDLQVRPADDPEFVALVEVRGYTGGAKANDLWRMVKFADLFRQDIGEPPSALWYVVNHFIEVPPGERPLVLAANEEEVSSFAADRNGAVIDTCDLFRLAEIVTSGELSREESRSLLVTVTGRLHLDLSAQQTTSDQVGQPEPARSLDPTGSKPSQSS
jgi:hypothetical protein